MLTSTFSNIPRLIASFFISTLITARYTSSIKAIQAQGDTKLNKNASIRLLPIYHLLFLVTCNDDFFTAAINECYVISFLFLEHKSLYNKFKQLEVPSHTHFVYYPFMCEESRVKGKWIIIAAHNKLRCFVFWGLEKFKIIKIYKHKNRNRHNLLQLCDLRLNIFLCVIF